MSLETGEMSGFRIGLEVRRCSRVMAGYSINKGGGAVVVEDKVTILVIRSTAKRYIEHVLRVV